MTDPNILAAVRAALYELGLITTAPAAPPAPPAERHIEDLAREWCAANRIDPDHPVTFGEMPPVPGTQAKFMSGTVRPAWTQFLDPVAGFANALGIPLRKSDKPGGYPYWISPDSVTEFRAQPMSRDDSSI